MSDVLAAVSAAADGLSSQFPDASVVVLVGREVDGHSLPYHAWRGACLPVLGLLDVGGKLVRETMPEAYRR